MLSAATLVAGLLTRNKRLSRSGLRMLGSLILATKTKSFIKHRIDRTRPGVILEGGHYHARKGHSSARAENSFPSGHTADAVALARAVVRDYPSGARLAYGAAAAAGAIQIPRGAHFMSDVLVGAAIGYLAEAIIGRLLRGHQPGSAIVRWPKNAVPPEEFI